MENINNSAMLPVGAELHDTYRIERYLSSGGFGNTYVARHIHFDEVHAVKEFFMRGITSRDGQLSVSVSNADNKDLFNEQLEKFKKEALRLRKLHNEHIVRVHDLFEENGTAYYIMDYVDGESLSERLKRTRKPATEDEVRRWLPQVLDALDAVHKAGMLHLDLKPGNIMLDRSGLIRIIDFGASKQQSGSGTSTLSTGISYTQGFAPREQMEQNRKKFGPWTDIYALGATLYNLLSNHHPPVPSDIDEDHSLDKHRSLPFPQGVSKDMQRLVVSMMATNRDNRPQSIGDVRRLLEGGTTEAKAETEETVRVIRPGDKTAGHVAKKIEEPPHYDEDFGEEPSFFARHQTPLIAGGAALAALLLILVLFRPSVGSDAANNAADSTAVAAAVEQVEDLAYDHDLGKCSYTGGIDSNGNPTGKGVATFYKANGAKERIYDGEFVDGKFQGEGTYEWIGGEKFSGTFKDNYCEKGRFVMADGSYFEGTFHMVKKNGVPTAEVYNGTWYSATGKLDAKVINGKEQ